MAPRLVSCLSQPHSAAHEARGRSRCLTPGCRPLASPLRRDAGCRLRLCPCCPAHATCELRWSIGLLLCCMQHELLGSATTTTQQALRRACVGRGTTLAANVTNACLGACAGPYANFGGQALYLKPVRDFAKKLRVLIWHDNDPAGRTTGTRAMRRRAHGEHTTLRRVLPACRTAQARARSMVH